MISYGLNSNITNTDMQVLFDAYASRYNVVMSEKLKFEKAKKL